jgi:cardiolipin synthase
MPDDFFSAVEDLIRNVPGDWLISACKILRKVPQSCGADSVIQSVPITNNADLSFRMAKVVQLAAGQMSLEALSWALSATSDAYHRRNIEQRIELLWSGPSPAGRIPARRIDQALYDLIAISKREIFLVTFAAAKIERLTGTLLKAAQIGVKIRLVLEFEQSSEGQLTYDSLKAFPK